MPRRHTLVRTQRGLAARTPERDDDTVSHLIVPCKESSRSPALLPAGRGIWRAALRSSCVSTVADMREDAGRSRARSLTRLNCAKFRDDIEMVDDKRVCSIG